MLSEGDKVRILHIHSETWLSIQCEKNEKEEFGTYSKSYEAYFTPNIDSSDFSDTFNITKVDSVAIETFNYSRSFFHPLRYRLLTCIKPNDIFIPFEIETELIQILRQLIFFTTDASKLDPLTCDEIPIHKNQTILMNTCIVHVLMEFILKASQDQNKPQPYLKLPSVQNVLRHIYRLLYVLLNGDVEFYGAYYYNYFRQIESHINLEVGVAEILSEMLQGCQSVNSKITHDDLDKFVEFSAQTAKTGKSLKFLTYLCSWKNVPVHRTQNLIMKKFFLVHANDNYFPKTRATKQNNESFVEILQEGQWIKLSQFLKENHTSTQVFFFESLLELYEKVCKGPNIENIKFIVEDLRLISEAECRAILVDSKIPLKFRVMYCSIFNTLFVNTLNEKYEQVNF